MRSYPPHYSRSSNTLNPSPSLCLFYFSPTPFSLLLLFFLPPSFSFCPFLFFLFSEKTKKTKTKRKQRENIPDPPLINSPFPFFFSHFFWYFSLTPPWLIVPFPDPPLINSPFPFFSSHFFWYFFGCVMCVCVCVSSYWFWGIFGDFNCHRSSVVKSAGLNKFGCPQVRGSIPSENTSTQIQMDLSK